MPKVTGLGHIGIFVRDLERMVAFYRDFLGLKITKQNWRAGVVFLSADAALLLDGKVLDAQVDEGGSVRFLVATTQ